MSLPLLASTFANNLLPILLLSGAGFILGKLFSVDSRTIGRIVFYIFAPMLVFDLLVQNDLKLEEAVTVMAFTGTLILIMGIITLIIGLGLKLERRILMSVLITTMFGNTGNYGLPVVSFAFGEEALKYAGLYFVTTSVLFNTVGILIASLGHMNFREAMVGLLKVPIVYGVTLAAIINILNIEIPAPLARTIDLAASGSIPLMIVLLGIELARVQWSNSLRGVGLSVSLRLLAAPLVALLLSLPFGLQGEVRQAGVIQASMPAAVNTTILAAEYQLDSSLVTAIVFIGTLLSPLTLTPLIVLLGR
ncbi:MAG: AEC family transporter [Anaerolineae bacterium]|nr:AEC family transporter [Anaerolineae bacterium]MCI0611058.1 AEC family transporter [Anaerolineae bacterium]